MNIQLDKNAFTFPIYKSIAEQITEQIRNGVIKTGEKLPTERELSTVTGISRGTIKAAFAELQKQGLITTIQGSGSFVSKTMTIPVKSVDEIIDTFFSDMRSLGYSLQEIETKFTKRLVQLYDRVKKVKIAWIDTCSEFINAAMADTSQMRCIIIDTYLRSDVLSDPTVLDSYDIIAVGGKNMDQFVYDAKIDPSKLEKVTLNLKVSCIINLAKTENHLRTLTWCMSDRFSQVMKNVLLDFENITVTHDIVGLCSYDELKSNLDAADVLLIPPEMPTNALNYTELLADFERRGGKIIKFEYQIDRGSFVHLQDKVKDIFYEYNEKN